MPFKPTSFQQYTCPTAKAGHVRMADLLTPGRRTHGENLDRLVAVGNPLKNDLNLTGPIRAADVAAKEFYEQPAKLAASAFDVQCLGAYLHYPLVLEIKESFLNP